MFCCIRLCNNLTLVTLLLPGVAHVTGVMSCSVMCGGGVVGVLLKARCYSLFIERIAKQSQHSIHTAGGDSLDPMAIVESF